MNKWTAIAVAAALLILALLGGYWFHQNYKYVREARPAPPQGPAAYDPFYAAARTLEAYGETAVPQPYLDLKARPPAPGDVIVYYGDVRHLTANAISRLEKWMRAGGQFVIHLPRGGDGIGPWLKKWGLNFVPADQSRCPEVLLAKGEAPMKLDVCGDRLFTGRLHDKVIGKNGGLVFLGIGVGKGELTVLSSLDFMTNASLKKSGNARFMLRVLAPNLGHGRIFLIYSVNVAPWPLLLWYHAWPFLAALTLLTLAWLTAIMPRFGPIRAAANPARRALLEHVRAAADTLWREGQRSVLYRAVRDNLKRRLRRRHPAAAAMPNRELIPYLAVLGELPEERVRTAFAGEEGELSRHFQEYITTLLHIRKRL